MRLARTSGVFDCEIPSSNRSGWPAHLGLRLADGLVHLLGRWKRAGRAPAAAPKNSQSQRAVAQAVWRTRENPPCIQPTYEMLRWIAVKAGGDGGGYPLALFEVPPLRRVAEAEGRLVRPK